MRYKIDYDKTINQLVPHYIGGRRIILYLQALVSPLQAINDSFVNWAKETRIEASMTSQIFKFEWFLNRKFRKYFANSEGRITISNGSSLGIPLYWQSEGMPDTAFYYQQNDDQESIDDNPAMYYCDERLTGSAFSFVVHVPNPDTTLITQSSYDSQLRYWIDRYRLASKTYNIQYHS